MRIIATLVVGFTLAAVASNPAAAHGRHHHPQVRFGLTIGGPVLVYGWVYPPPWYVWPYVQPRVVVAPAPVYIERDAQTEGRSWWYYCPETRAYYPYVRSCPGGWERVSPRPPN